MAILPISANELICQEACEYRKKDHRRHGRTPRRINEQETNAQDKLDGDKPNAEEERRAFGNAIAFERLDRKSVV